MKIRAFNLSMAGVVSRFYAMMLTAIALGFMGVSWVLIAFITFAFAFTTILGVSFELPTKETKVVNNTTMSTIKGGREVRKVG